jgi:hypothetical protein
MADDLEGPNKTVHNEIQKLRATFCNAAGITAATAGFVLPIMRLFQEPGNWTDVRSWVFSGISSIVRSGSFSILLHASIFSASKSRSRRRCSCTNRKLLLNGCFLWSPIIALLKHFDGHRERLLPLVTWTEVT